MNNFNSNLNLCNSGMNNMMGMNNMIGMNNMMMPMGMNASNDLLSHQIFSLSNSSGNRMQNMYLKNIQKKK